MGDEVPGFGFIPDDESLRDVYVDRDLSRWPGPSRPWNLKAVDAEGRVTREFWATDEEKRRAFGEPPDGWIYMTDEERWEEYSGVRAEADRLREVVEAAGAKFHDMGNVEGWRDPGVPEFPPSATRQWLRRLFSRAFRREQRP